VPYPHPTTGHGHWPDGSPFLPHGMDSNDEDIHWHTVGAGARVPFDGFFPARGETPQLTPNQYKKVTIAVTGAANNGSGLIRLTITNGSVLATGNSVNVQDVGGTTEANATWTITKINDTTIDLQASTFTNAYTSGGIVFLQPGAYVPIYGKQAYRVDRWDGADTSPALIRSNHEFLSYGQDLTGSWSHKGASTCVYMTTALLDNMRQGLKIRPKNAAGRTAWYVVNGVYRIPISTFAGYVTVCRVAANDNYYLEGDKDTTFTGTVIEQERYDFSTVAWV
jgi:hypothetical protein